MIRSQHTTAAHATPAQAEGRRPVVSGTRYVVMPGASGPIDGDPGEVDTIPVLLARFGGTTAIPLLPEGMGVEAMSIVGDWDVTIKTPIGSSYIRSPTTAALPAPRPARVKRCHCVTLSLTDNGYVASVGDQTDPVEPDFDVVVDGDRLTAHSKAGRLPRSAVTGVRRQGRIS